MTAHAHSRSADHLWLSARDIAPLLSVATQRDAATHQAILEELDLNPDAVDRGDARIALADYFRLTRAHAAASFEESLGLAPRPLVSGTTDFVMAQASAAGTLYDAMHHVAGAYNKLHGGVYNFVELSDDTVIYRIDDAAFPYTRPADESVTLLMECTLIYLHSAFCSILADDITPAIRQVFTRRKARAQSDPLLFWSCPVRCRAPWFAIAYSAETAARPVTGHGQRPSEHIVHNRILSLIEKREAALALQPAVTAEVRQALREGLRDQDKVAQRLGCSVATLRRKLAQEGRSFRKLRQDFLNETAKLRLLRTPRIADIADDLGFSDSRSFTRAFKGWNGRSPKSYRSGLKTPR